MYTIPTLGKEWRVSLDFKPTDYSYTGHASLLHLTLGANSGTYGDRYPAVLFHPSEGICIASAVNDDHDYFQTSLLDRPKIGEWTSLDIAQEQEEGGKFVFRIVIGGKEISSVENTNPVEMKDVKVYASDPWHPAQPGSIKAWLIQTKLGQFCFLLLLLD